MVWSKYERRGSNFVVTSLGIVTSDNIWFHTTREAIEDYAEGLLDEYPLEELVPEARNWVKSCSNLSLLLYMAMGCFMPANVTVVATILFFLAWYYLRSLFAAPALKWVVKIVNTEVILMGSTLIALSYMGIMGRYTAFGIGVAVYLLFKLDLVRKFIDYLLRIFSSSPMSINDKIFKMLITRYAIKHHIVTADTGELRDHIMKLFEKRKSK